MSTPNDVYLMAYAKSKKNQPGEIATEATELLGLITRALRGLFAFGARVSPQFFGIQADVTGASSKWALPTDVESLYRIEYVTGGAKVELVPFDDRTAAEPDPSVYHFGQSIYAAGNANDPDPAADDLRFFYAKSAETPASATVELDSLWDEDYDELLAYELAIYLALKDGRNEEVIDLRKDRDRWALLFAAHLEHYMAGEVDRWPGSRALSTERIVPIQRLLAGGSEIELGGA